MSKECPLCGENNKDSASICIGCKTAFSDHISSAPVLRLIDRDGKIIIITGDCTIGRLGDVETEYFAKNEFVSKLHCKITLENGEFKIEHISNTNPTKINNDKLPKGIQKKLRNGDYLEIADIIFKISISSGLKQDVSMEEETEKKENESIGTGKINYIIICPKCGSRYEVHNINDRINECNYCDVYDKKEISKVGASIKYAD